MGALEQAKSQETAELQIKQFKCPDLGVNKLSRMKYNEKESRGKCSPLWSTKSFFGPMPAEGSELPQMW